MAKKVAIHQFLSRTGLFPDKAGVFSALADGEVSIDSRVVRNPRFQFRESKHKVFFRGKEVFVLGQSLYILLNKPEGYLSSRLSVVDKRLGKKSIFDLVSLDVGVKRTLFCVGRLDEKSSGLIILTNDGCLSSFLTDPKNKVLKVYDVFLESPIIMRDVGSLREGVVIRLEDDGVVSDYKTAPCRVVVHGPGHLSVALTEGKKRQVRRMFEAVGSRVSSLSRVSIGKLSLGRLGLRAGEYVFVEREFILENLF